MGLFLPRLLLSVRLRVSLVPPESETLAAPSILQMGFWAQREHYEAGPVGSLQAPGPRVGIEEAEAAGPCKSSQGSEAWLALRTASAVQTFSEQTPGIFEVTFIIEGLKS